MFNLLMTLVKRCGVTEVLKEALSLDVVIYEVKSHATLSQKLIEIFATVIGKKDVAATSPDKSADSTAAAGSSGAVGTKLCPTGYSPPIGDVYKQCTFGEPVKVVQRCLGGLVDDGKFGIKTLNQLMVLKGIEQFTEADVPKICAVQANTTVPTQSDTPPVAATVKPKYQPLDVVPIGSSSDNLYSERF
jgi:hypothetical protein